MTKRYRASGGRKEDIMKNICPSKRISRPHVEGMEGRGPVAGDALSEKVTAWDKDSCRSKFKEVKAQ